MEFNNPRAESTAPGVDCDEVLRELDVADSTPLHETYNPAACPRFAKCSANICPLDSGWYRRKHLRCESVCYYLRAFAKVGSKVGTRPSAGGCIPSKLAGVVIRHHSKIIERFGDIRRRLKRISARAASQVAQQGGQGIDGSNTR